MPQTARPEEIELGLYFDRIYAPLRQHNMCIIHDPAHEMTEKSRLEGEAMRIAREWFPGYVDHSSVSLKVEALPEDEGFVSITREELRKLIAEAWKEGKYD